MSDKKINMIQTVGANFASDPNSTPDDKSTEMIVRLVVSSLIRGFREDTLGGKQIKTANDALIEIGQDLGRRLHVGEEIAPQARTVLGLQWISQLAQAAWIGMLTDDPVVALAIAEVWNQSHADMHIVGLTEEQRERHEELMEGEYDPIGAVMEAVANFNQYGCQCGKSHDGTDTVDNLSAASLLKGLDPEVLETLSALAALSGTSQESLVETLRDVYLAGGSKGAGAAALMAQALGAQAQPEPTAEQPEVHMGVVELKGGSSADQLVEKLYSELVQAQGKDWNDATRAKLRAEIRKNLPAILAGGPVKIEIDLT